MVTLNSELSQDVDTVENSRVHPQHAENNTSHLLTPRLEQSQPSRSCQLSGGHTPLLSALPPLSQWEEGMKIFGHSREPPVILIDMDNTLVDWESNFHRLMELHHPDISILPPNERTNFKIELNYPDQFRSAIVNLTSLDGYWLDMKPCLGAVKAVHQMVEYGLIVQIVTTPDEKFTARSAYEKILWIENNLGKSWKYRVILACDKTYIQGDILIDDRPSASIGVLHPTWNHLLYKQPYNHTLNCPILQTWENWGPVVYEMLLNREAIRKDSSDMSSTCHDIRFSVSSNNNIPLANIFTPSPGSSKSHSHIRTNEKQCCNKQGRFNSIRQSMAHV